MVEVVADTNILVRLLTDDPPHQAETARQILQVAERDGIEVVVAPLIVAEIVYVLERVYGWPKDRLIPRLRSLLLARPLKVLEHGIVARALEWHLEVPSLHFADAYVASLAMEAGHSRGVSFDGAMARVPGISAIQTPADLSS